MEKIKKMFSSKSSRNGTYSVGLAVIVIAIAIVINLVAGQLPEKVRNIDISSNNLYDISSVSTKMLKKLDKKVDLKVIAEQDSVDTRIKTFVKKYAALSGKVKVEWVDSVLHPSVLQKYNTDGNVIVVSCDATGKSTTISFSDIIQSDYYSYYTTGSASESSFDGEGQLTSAINYVTSEETSKIYRTSGHGEATFSSSVSDLLTKNNLETEEINLSMNPEIPDDCDLLFLYAPTSDIIDDEKTIIEKYLSDGGKVYLILGDTTSDTPNLDGIMSDYGLKKVSGYIADTQRCYQGNYYAIFPQLSLSGDLGSGISNQMVLLLNSPGMEKTDTDNDNLTVTPFMQTSDSGYAVTENDQTQGQYILGAVSTNAISADSSDSDSEDEDDKSDATDTDTKTARLTVLASASMISSDITDQLTTLDNLTLFVNSVTENFDNVNNVAIEAKSLSTETNTPMHAGAFSILVIFIIPLVTVTSDNFVKETVTKPGDEVKTYEADNEDQEDTVTSIMTALSGFYFTDCADYHVTDAMLGNYGLAEDQRTKVELTYKDTSDDDKEKTVTFYVGSKDDSATYYYVQMDGSQRVSRVLIDTVEKALGWKVDSSAE